MGASDLIKALQNLARRGPSTYGECRLKQSPARGLPSCSRLVTARKGGGSEPVEQLIFKAAAIASYDL
jgi:hypothetical protein